MDNFSQDKMIFNFTMYKTTGESSKQCFLPEHFREYCQLHREAKYLKLSELDILLSPKVNKFNSVGKLLCQSDLKDPSHSNDSILNFSSSNTTHITSFYKLLYLTVGTGTNFKKVYFIIAIEDAIFWVRTVKQMPDSEVWSES